MTVLLVELADGRSYNEDKSEFVPGSYKVPEGSHATKSAKEYFATIYEEDALEAGYSMEEVGWL